MHSFKSHSLPPASFMRLLNECAVAVHDPVQKLKFIKRTIESYHSLPKYYKNLSLQSGEIASQRIILKQLKRFDYPVQFAIKKIILQKKLPFFRILFWRTYKYRQAIAIVVTCTLLLLVTILYQHIDTFRQGKQQTTTVKIFSVPQKKPEIPEYVTDKI